MAIAQLALTTLLVQVPGMGDSIQTLKAGALEIGDVLIVTKADRPESAELARDLRRLQTLTFHDQVDAATWKPPVIATSTVTGEGIDKVMSTIADHRHWLQTSGALRERKRVIATAELTGRVRRRIIRSMDSMDNRSAGIAEIIDAIAERRMTPQQGAGIVLAGRWPDAHGADSD